MSAVVGVVAAAGLIAGVSAATPSPGRGSGSSPAPAGTLLSLHTDHVRTLRNSRTREGVRARSSTPFAKSIVGQTYTQTAGQASSGPTAWSDATPSPTAQASPATSPKVAAAVGPSAASLTWVVDWSTAKSIASDPAAVAAIKGATIYEIVRVGGKVAPGLPAVATLDFKSVSQMAAAFTAGDIAPWDRAVVYDPEHWSATPLSEQLAVVSATAEAKQLAAQYHLTFIATPGTDLMEVLTPGQWPLAKDYLQYDLAGKCAAAGPALFDIQAQALETNLAAYMTQVSGATAQIHAANPATLALGDVTDHIGSSAIPTADVVAAIRASEADVTGYFLNAPVEGGAIIQALG